ncbi:carbohydrate ABC transporter substrate-binding protein, CUT1 family [Streptomyces misionensis]|uniref:Carbohydrate ABC transporter substrate-binding protein, CUT1 family n=1 Tax=Streptomyces misionensis TaxID=67331 RepID=A0A1H5E6M1_9ACTN|nr:extracellular solute-binding protein [Streptomyces misionensis]SED86660.1 carbohydrate ABC transporter substrate-binding protein, CUT1 family [Streptomyces misionensis]
MSAHPGGGPARRRTRTVTVVASCLVLLAAAVVLGIRAAGREPTVTLLANWTGRDEGNLRRTVIEPFERKYHVRVDYQGSSAESQVLGADVEAGTPPDVVVLTGPGELADYAGQKQLQPLEGLISREDFSASWATPLTDGHVYWFPLKADLKSIVWYPAGTGERQRRQARDQPAQWCVGMGSGATSGWPGTDWIEDILLQQQGPRTYQAWAGGRLSWRSPEVRKAWTTWGLLMGAGTSDTLLRRTLQTDYGKASAPVAADPRGCTLEHQASFIRTQSDAWKRVDGRYEPSARLIPGATAHDAWEVSGDLVALLHATPQAEQLIRYLASANAQRAWNTAESGFSVHAGAQPAPGAAGPAWHRGLAATLLDRRAAHCFDASDAMPPTVRDAFAEATIDYLAHPGHLETLLTNLDTLTRAPDQTWLPSVCDQVP